MFDWRSVPRGAALNGVWAVTGTPVSAPYPCRCHERKFNECSPAWCPCAGRIDPLPEPCCSSRFGPEEHVQAMRAWREKKIREGAT